MCPRFHSRALPDWSLQLHWGSKSTMPVSLQARCQCIKTELWWVTSMSTNWVIPNATSWWSININKPSLRHVLGNPSTGWIGWTLPILGSCMEHLCLTPSPGAAFGQRNGGSGSSGSSGSMAPCCEALHNVQKRAGARAWKAAWNGASVAFVASCKGL